VITRKCIYPTGSLKVIETMFCSGYENCPEFGVLGGVIFKLDIL
jgi:hypothetical protein